MSQRIALEVVGLRPADDPVPRFRLSGRGLLALKALALVALAAVPLSGRLIPPALPGLTVAPAGGVELSFPAGWNSSWSTEHAAVVREERGCRASSCRSQPCQVFLMRFTFDGFAKFYRGITCRSLDQGWNNDTAAVLSAVAAVMRMDATQEPRVIGGLRIGGRPAAMLVSRFNGRWGAVAVAPAGDLALAGLFAPTARDLERVWRQWTAMLAAARLFEPVGCAMVADASPNDD